MIAGLAVHRTPALAGLRAFRAASDSPLIVYKASNVAVCDRVPSIDQLGSCKPASLHLAAIGLVLRAAYRFGS